MWGVYGIIYIVVEGNTTEYFFERLVIMSIEKRIAYIERKVDYLAYVNEMAEKIIKGFEEFDGKILNCRLQKTLEEKCSKFINVTIEKERFVIGLIGDRNGFNYRDKRYFSVTGKAIEKTEGGKSRLVASEAINQMRKYIDANKERIKVLNNGKNEIETIRNEMQKISDTMMLFKKKYDKELIGIAGCDYQLRDINGYNELKDITFTVY